MLAPLLRARHSDKHFRRIHSCHHHSPVTPSAEYPRQMGAEWQPSQPKSCVLVHPTVRWGSPASHPAFPSRGEGERGWGGLLQRQTQGSQPDPRVQSGEAGTRNQSI